MSIHWVIGILILLIVPMSDSGQTDAVGYQPSLSISVDNICEIELLHEITHSDSASNNVMDIDFSISGRYMAYVRQDRFVVWDVNIAEIVWELPILAGAQVEFSSADVLAVQINTNVYVWDDVEQINKWEQVRQDDGTGVLGVNALRFSEDGSEIVLLTATDYGLIRWSLDEERIIDEKRKAPAGYESIYPPGLLTEDGSIAAIMPLSGNSVAIVNTQTNDEIGEISFPESNSSWIQLLTFAHYEGEQVLILSVQSSSGEPNSRLVIVTLQGEILHEVLYEFDTMWTLSELNPSGELLLLWNNSDGRLYFFSSDYTTELCAIDMMHGVGSLAFSPDGTLLASGGADGTVRLWGIPAGE